MRGDGTPGGCCCVVACALAGNGGVFARYKSLKQENSGGHRDISNTGRTVQPCTSHLSVTHKFMRYATYVSHMQREWHTKHITSHHGCCHTHTHIHPTTTRYPTLPHRSRPCCAEAAAHCPWPEPYRLASVALLSCCHDGRGRSVPVCKGSIGCVATVSQVAARNNVLLARCVYLRLSFRRHTTLYSALARTIIHSTVG